MSAKRRRRMKLSKVASLVPGCKPGRISHFRGRAGCSPGTRDVVFAVPGANRSAALLLHVHAVELDVVRDLSWCDDLSAEPLRVPRYIAIAERNRHLDRVVGHQLHGVLYRLRITRVLLELQVQRLDV